MIESNQKDDFNLNKYIYVPNEDDLENIEDYLKCKFNTEMNYVLKNQYIYILKGDQEGFDEKKFDPNSYEFSESDFRVCFKYVCISILNSNIKNYNIQ